MRWNLLLAMLASLPAYGIDSPPVSPAAPIPPAPAGPEVNRPQPQPATAPVPCPGCPRSGTPSQPSSPSSSDATPAPASVDSMNPAGKPAPSGEASSSSGNEIKDPTRRAAPAGRAPALLGNDIRDPTKEPKRFRDAWKQMVPAPSKGTGATVAKPKIPEIRLAGKSLGGGRPPSVLLQVDQKTYLLKQGGQLTLQTQSKELLTVRVESISADGVQLVVLPYGDRVSLY